MKGYWNRPAENEAVFREIDGRRYFLTGDIGHIDEDGYVVITDRKKDMILVGGFNCLPPGSGRRPLYPPQSGPGRRRGRAGRQERRDRSRPSFSCEPGETATEEEIREFCKENMAGYKRPKMIEFRDDMPVSNVGKVLRRVLRDEEQGKA